MAKHIVLAGMLAGLRPLTGAAAQPIELPHWKLQSRWRLSHRELIRSATTR